MEHTLGPAAPLRPGRCRGPSAAYVHGCPVGEGVAVRRRGAQAVLLLVVGARRLHVADEGCPEAREAGRIGCRVIADGRQTGTRGGFCRPDAAQCTTTASFPTATEPSSRVRRPGSARRMCPSRTTCSMLRSWSSSQVVIVGAFAIVGVTDRSMRSMMGVLEAEEQFVQRRRRRCGLHDARGHPQEHRRIGLDHVPVKQPGIAGPHPADRIGVHPAPEQPDAGVGRGLARPHDHVLARSVVKNSEVVDRDHVDTVRDPERRRRVRWDVRGKVAGVDDPAALRHLEPLAGDARDDLPIVDVLAVGEQLDPPRREQPVAKDAHVSRRGSRRQWPVSCRPASGPRCCTRPPPSSVDATP